MEEFKPQAYMVLSTMGGIQIMLDETGDRVRYQWYNEKPTRWCKIYYDNKGHYFYVNRHKYYLDQFLKFSY